MRNLLRVRFEKKRSQTKQQSRPSSLRLTHAITVFNKMDELRLRASQLSPEIPDTAINIEGYCTYRADRNSHGGGILHLRSSLTTVTLGLDSSNTSTAGSDFLPVFVKELSILFIMVYHTFSDNNSANKETSSHQSDLINSSFLQFGKSLRL